MQTKNSWSDLLEPENEWPSSQFKKKKKKNMKKKLSIIGTVGLPANYGGFETLTHHLVKHLGNTYDMTVYCSGKRYPKNVRKESHEGARLCYLPFNANGIQSIIYDTISIIHALIYADILLVLGVSGAWVFPFVRLFTNKKIIVSIDGIEWKRDKWNLLAKCYLWWAEKIAVKYSHIDISDNESIQDYTAVRYGSLSRIIEYGADHVIQKKASADDKAQYPFLKRPYAFKVCRIEPENNIHEVLQAFSESPRHVLVIVGNWDNSDYGRNLRRQFGQFSNINMLNPIYDQEKLDVLRGNALVYIHGHSAGGTNPSLVEAMYLGLPVIAFDVSYNRTTTEGKAVYFTDAQSLKESIQTLSVSLLKAKASQMKEVANRRYTWEKIANDYNYYFKAVLSADKKVAVLPRLAKANESLLLEYNAAHLKYQKLFFEKELQSQ